MVPCSSRLAKAGVRVLLKCWEEDCTAGGVTEHRDATGSDAMPHVAPRHIMRSIQGVMMRPIRGRGPSIMTWLSRGLTDPGEGEQWRWAMANDWPRTHSDKARGMVVLSGQRAPGRSPSRQGVCGWLDFCTHSVWQLKIFFLPCDAVPRVNE